MKIKIRYIPYLLVCFGIFIFPYSLRNAIIPSIAGINIFVYLGLIYGYNKGIIRLISNKFIKFLLAIFILVSISLLIYVKDNGWDYIFKFKLIFIYILPILFLNIEIPKKENLDLFIIGFYKVLKKICLLMVVFGLLDKLLGNVIQGFWASFYDSSTLKYMVNSGRLVSFYGHPLTNTYLFLTFLSWVLMLKELYNIKNKYVINILIALLGIAMTGSKSGIIIAIALLLIYHVGLKNIKYMFIVVALMVVLYTTGIFDLVFDRLMEGIAAGDISTSRNSALTRLLENGTIKFDLLKGNVIDYSYTSMIAALEYPFLRWSYTSGILFTITMYLGYFVFPIVRIISGKNMRVLICTLCLMIYVNGNNGISAYNDDLLLYSINIGLIILILKQSLKNSCKISTGGEICQN